MAPSLEEAVQAIKAGDKKTGRALLADILQSDFDNEQAWLWLSSVVETEKEKRRCLEQVLRINPDNQAAQRGMATLESQTPQPSAQTGDPAAEEARPPKQTSLGARVAAAPPRQKELDLEVISKKSAESEPEPGVSEPQPVIKESPSPRAEPSESTDEPDVGLPPVVPAIADDRNRFSSSPAETKPDQTESAEEEGEQDEADIVGLDSATVDEETQAEDVDEETSPDEEGISDEDEFLDDEEYLEEPDDRPFWQTERGLTIIGGGAVALLLACVACSVIFLVFRPVLIEVPATVEAALGTPTPTITPTPVPPTDTPTPTVTPSPTNTPTFTPSPTATPVVFDTPTVTPTPSRTPTVDPNRQLGQIIEVISGDLIRVRIDGVEYDVKYLAIDAPDLDEVLGSEAQEINSLLVGDKAVTLERDVTDQDAEGRLLRYVFVGDLHVNEEMVRQGVARVDLEPPDTKYGARLQEVEQGARLANIGLWSLE